MSGIEEQFKIKTFIKAENHMFTSIDTEETLDKIQPYS